MLSAHIIVAVLSVYKTSSLFCTVLLQCCQFTSLFHLSVQCCCSVVSSYLCCSAVSSHRYFTSLYSAVAVLSIHITVSLVCTVLLQCCQFTLLLQCYCDAVAFIAVTSLSVPSLQQRFQRYCWYSTVIITAATVLTLSSLSHYRY